MRSMEASWRIAWTPQHRPSLFCVTSQHTSVTMSIAVLSIVLHRCVVSVAHWGILSILFYVDSAFSFPSISCAGLVCMVFCYTNITNTHVYTIASRSFFTEETKVNSKLFLSFHSVATRRKTNRLHLTFWKFHWIHHRKFTLYFFIDFLLFTSDQHLNCARNFF